MHLRYLVGLRPPSAAVMCRYDFGRAVDVSYIPLFGVEEGVRGTVFHEFGEGARSVELTFDCADAKLVKMKVYSHLIHYLKAKGVNIEMPQTIRSMKTRLEQIQGLLMSLHGAHNTLLCGF